MKKALFLVVALVLITGIAFAADAPAGVTLGAWGRGIFVVVGSGGVDPMSKQMASWGPAGPRLGFTVSGNSASAGFQIDFYCDNNAIAAGDQQKIWIKPIEGLTLQAGEIYDDTLRGSTSYGIYNWLRLGGINGDGHVFSRVGENPLNADGGGKGANFEASYANSGLYIAAAFGGNGLKLMDANEPVKTADMFQYGQYQIGYTIPGIGMIRAQYVGQVATKKAADPSNLITIVDAASYGYIQAAFKLTAVQNLTVDISGYVPTDSDKAVSPNAPTGTGVTAGGAIFAQYGMGPLTLDGEANLLVPKTGDMNLDAGVGASYTVDQTSGIGVEGDIRYQNKAYSGQDNGAVGFMIGLTKGFSNGVCGIGFEGTTGHFATNWGNELIPKSDPNGFVWAVPIRLEYWF